MVWERWDLEFQQQSVLKFANPDKEVVLFVGDGGFQMTNQELAILNIYKVPIKVVMLNQPLTWNGPPVAGILL